MAVCSMHIVLPGSTEPTVGAGSRGNALSDTLSLSQNIPCMLVQCMLAPHFVLLPRLDQSEGQYLPSGQEVQALKLPVSVASSTALYQLHVRNLMDVRVINSV